MSELREKVASRIDAWIGDIGASREMADAAIAAVLEAMERPSAEVVEEGRWPAEDDGPLACWQAMLAAFRKEQLGDSQAGDARLTGDS